MPTLFDRPLSLAPSFDVEVARLDNSAEAASSMQRLEQQEALLEATLEAANQAAMEAQRLQQQQDKEEAARAAVVFEVQHVQEGILALKRDAVPAEEQKSIRLWVAHDTEKWAQVEDHVL